MWKKPRSTSLPPVLAMVVIAAAHLIVPTTSAIISIATPEEQEAPCPTSCDMYFSKLIASHPPSEGTYSQYVQLRERGEPKSGTGFAFDWGAEGLVHACKHLKQVFGEESCRMEFETSENGGDIHLTSCSFTFEPGKASQDARCFCPEVERVSILALSEEKHTLPVETNCSWAHGRGVDVGRHRGCRFPDGLNPKNYREIWDCMEANQCLLTAGDDQQMVVFRDPRPVAVSTYFWKGIYKKVDGHGQPLETVDEYALRVLPTLCRWIAVRHILFGEYLADQSTIFWSDDITTDPIEYHRAWLASVGLEVPMRELKKAAEATIRGEFDFWTKGIDPHSGSSSNSRRNRTTSSWRDEVGSETVEIMDPVLRQWLPPVFLSKLGIPQGA